MSIVIAPLITDGGGLIIGPLFVPDDTDAAQFTAGPAVSLITQTGFRVAFTVNEASTVYGIAVAQGSALPTPEQIIAGINYGSVTVLDSQQVSVSAGVANYLTFANIVGQAGNNVRAYLTAVDAAGNIQAQGDILTALAQLLPAVTPDATAPVITLAGANPMRLVVGQAYVEPGYSAVDNVDGPIAQDAPGWTVTSTVNINAVGSYSVTYQVADAAGNVGTATRVVNVAEQMPAGYMQLTGAAIAPGNKLYPGNDFVFSGTLTDDNGNPITSGTVTLTIKTTAGVEVSGMTWPAALSHVADGQWTIAIDASIELRLLRRYVLELSASSEGLDGFWSQVYSTEHRRIFE